MGAGADRQARKPQRLRTLVIALVVAQILLPSAMFGVRLVEPSRGQLPFGWQMHSSCWGNASCE